MLALLWSASLAAPVHGHWTRVDQSSLEVLNSVEASTRARAEEALFSPVALPSMDIEELPSDGKGHFNITEMYEPPSMVPLDGNRAVIILADPRSGSSWLVDFLAEHEEASYLYAECFNNKRESVPDCFEELNIDTPNNYTKLPVEKLLTLLLQKIQQPWKEHSHVYGFKIMVSQLYTEHVERFASFVNKNNVKILSLVRHNVLRRCFSVHSLHANHVATSRTESKPNPVHVETDWWHRCNDRNNVLMQYRKDFLKLVEGNLVEQIAYEGLAAKTEETLEKIRKFVGFKAPIKSSFLKKMHSGDLSEFIENWDETLPVINEVFGKDQVKAMLKE